MSQPVKVLLAVVAVVLVVIVLFTWVFPWFERNFVNDPTLESVSGSHAGGQHVRGQVA